MRTFRRPRSPLVVGLACLALALPLALTARGTGVAAAATTPTYVVAGDDPNVTGDQWGLVDGAPSGGYFSQLRTLLADPARFGPNGTVNATFTIRSTPVPVPLVTGALDEVDVYFLSARDAPTAAEVTVLQAFVQRGGAVVVNSNAPYFFDDTQWLGFTLTPRVVFGDGGLGYTTTHKSPQPSSITNTTHPVTNGPFGAVTQFFNWHTVDAFASLPPQAVPLARVTNLTGPDNNGSNVAVTISGPTLAAIPARALGATSGPILATSDVDTFSNAYDGTAISYPTDTDCRLVAAGVLTSNGRLALNTFAWIAAEKASLVGGGTTTTTTTGTTSSTTSAVTTTTRATTTTTSTTTTSSTTTTTRKPRRR